MTGHPLCVPMDTQEVPWRLWAGFTNIGVSLRSQSIARSRPAICNRAEVSQNMMLLEDGASRIKIVLN